VRIRRILVGVDASEGSLAALRVSAELARALDAELVGLFVEDRDVVALAGLPFAREVAADSGEARPLEREALRRDLDALRRRARRILERTARTSRIRWSFRSAEGPVPSELDRAAREADLVIVGVRSRSGGRPGSTARALLGSDRPVMVVRVGTRTPTDRCVRVAWDGSAGAVEGLRLAATVARARRCDLRVVDMAQEGGPSDSRDVPSLGDVLRDLAVPARVVRPRAAGTAGLLEGLTLAGAGLVILPRTLFGDELRRGRLLRIVDGPILVVG